MIQSVDRAIRVLTALQGARRLSLSELAARLELAPSTTHGIVRTLVEHGMVVQERGSSRYQLGPAVLRLGNVYLDTLELRSKTIPWAEDLARRTGMAVRTGVLLVDDVVIIHHEPRPDGSRQMPEVGIVIPAHASALGKAMLAFLPDEADRILEGRCVAEHDRGDGHRPGRARCAARGGPADGGGYRDRRGGHRRRGAGQPGLRLLGYGRRSHRRRRPIRRRRGTSGRAVRSAGDGPSPLPRARRRVLAAATRRLGVLQTKGEARASLDRALRVALEGGGHRDIALA